MLHYLAEHVIEFANLLIALVGLPVLIWHVKGVHKWVEAQTVNIHAHTLGHLYDQYFDLCRTLLAKPHLRAYLYDGALLTNGERNSAERRSEVDTVCEMMTGLLEHAVIQQENCPKDTWANCWNPFLKEMYKRRNSELAIFYRTNRHFYSREFQAVVDPLVAQDATGAAATNGRASPSAPSPLPGTG
jgi:hypothetical protein